MVGEGAEADTVKNKRKKRLLRKMGLGREVGGGKGLDVDTVHPRLVRSAQDFENTFHSEPLSITGPFLESTTVNRSFFHYRRDTSLQYVRWTDLIDFFRRPNSVCGV